MPVLFDKQKPLLSAEVQEHIVQAIRAAEAQTTGELRVFVEPHCAYVEALERAREVFKELAMEKTERRNAVLIYVAIRDRQFAIFGDEAIYSKAGGPQFWEGAATILQQQLRAGHLAAGLRACIEALGAALAQHFPYDPSIRKNELPDEIVFGK